MILFQEAAHGVEQAVEHAAAAAHAFHPVAPWAILLLPLLGFALNAGLAMWAARRKLPRLPAVGDPYWDAHHAAPSEAEHHDHGVDPHPADAAAGHHHDDAHDEHAHGAPKPWTHVLPSWIAPLAVFGAFVVTVLNFLALRGQHGPFEAESYWSWMPVGELQVDFGLLVDPLSVLMALVITGVGTLIHVFSIGYMKEDPGYPRYMAYLNLFVFFMLVLVLGSSYAVTFVGWEGVGLCSYLLIGFWFREKANADAGKKAFIVNRIGDFGFLMAMFLLFANLGTLNYAEVAAAAPRLAFGGALVTTICLFLFLGATGKSAQIPLYTWLPDAMAGPTPVSALIHAATMVTAGVFLIVRSNVLFTLAPAASLTVAVVGALTAFFAATIGLKQWDIKKVLAYSTVSQLGFMFAAVGVGAYVAGVFHLMTHAFFKACLFLGSGSVIHSMHHALHATHNEADAQDMRNMGGLKKYLPITFVTMGVSTLAIAGVPFFAGFFSKDEIIGAALLGAEGASALSGAEWLGIPGRTVMGFVWGTLTLAALMTAFYMGRMMLFTFWGPFRAGAEEERHLHEGNWTITFPLVALGLLATLGGFLNVEHVPVVEWFDWFGLGTALHDWLHPVLLGSEEVVAAHVTGMEEAHHAAWPILLAIAIGVGGLLLAYFVVPWKTVGDEKAEPAYRGSFAKTLYHKWYVDEVYDVAVVGVVKGLSHIEAAFDRLLDGTIDFFGRMAEWIGVGAGRVQTGQVNTYAFVLILGVLALLGTFVL